MADNNEQFEAILKEVNSEVGDDKVETTTFAYPPTVPTGAKVDAPLG